MCSRTVRRVNEWVKWGVGACQAWFGRLDDGGGWVVVVADVGWGFRVAERMSFRW